MDEVSFPNPRNQDNMKQPFLVNVMNQVQCSDAGDWCLVVKNSGEADALEKVAIKIQDSGVGDMQKRQGHTLHAWTLWLVNLANRLERSFLRGN